MALPVGQTGLVGQSFRMQMRIAINLPLTMNGRYLGDIASQSGQSPTQTTEFQASSTVR